MHPFEGPHADQELLSKPIKELGLRIEGSPIEKYVLRLYKELERKGLKCFKPRCYLTDEWGCPDQEPVIGIPFYLADRKLADLEKSMNDLEDEREIMMYLRHEAGHAFNYAYELFKTEDWKTLFGPFRRPYRDRYRPVPFSRRFVRHMAGWYAQKHPDEDFAETFAVWLTPRSNWRARYKGWGALHKLRYVDKIARKFGDTPPLKGLGETDVTVDEMEVTLQDFYKETTPDESQAIADLALDSDLSDIFLKGTRRKRGVVPAGAMMGEHRKEIVDKVTYWTGVRRPLVKKLVDCIVDRVATMKLVAVEKREAAYVVEVTAYATTLAMNYLTRGKFIHE